MTISVTAPDALGCSQWSPSVWLSARLGPFVSQAGRVLPPRVSGLPLVFCVMPRLMGVFLWWFLGVGASQGLFGSGGFGGGSRSAAASPGTVCL